MVKAALLLATLLQGPVTIHDLAWLEGHWRTDGPQPANEARFTEEHWIAPLEGAMFGIGRTIRNRRTPSFEYLRIVEEGRQLVYIAQPDGGTAVRFPMVSSGPREVVFANPAHDYPQRIVYRRDGERIVATISLADGSRPQSWTFLRRPGAAR